jgi:hypothetical protein
MILVQVFLVGVTHSVVALQGKETLKREEMILSYHEIQLNFSSPVVEVHLASWDWRKGAFIRLN